MRDNNSPDPTIHGAYGFTLVILFLSFAKKLLDLASVGLSVVGRSVCLSKKCQKLSKTRFREYL